MLARRVCFDKTLPMFVLVASLLLAKCVSGQTAEITSASPASGGTMSPSFTDSTLHVTSESTNINNTHLPAITHATSSPSKNNITNATKPPPKTVTKSPQETHTTNVFSVTFEKSPVIANASNAVKSTETNLPTSTSASSAVSPILPHPSGHTDVNSSQLTTIKPVAKNPSEAVKPTNVTPQISEMNTSVSASTKAYNATGSTVSPVNSTESSATLENTTMPITDGEHTSKALGARATPATACGLLLATVVAWAVA